MWSMYAGMQRLPRHVQRYQKIQEKTGIHRETDRGKIVK